MLAMEGRTVVVRDRLVDDRGHVALHLSPHPDRGGWWTAPMAPDRHLVHSLHRPPSPS